MVICCTIRDLHRRRRMKNRRNACTEGGNAREAFPRGRLEGLHLRSAAHSDFRYRQMRIAAVVAALDLDFDFRPITGAEGDRSGQDFPSDGFGERRQAYLDAGCDVIIPTKANHPQAAAIAWKAAANCARLQFTCVPDCPPALPPGGLT